MIGIESQAGTHLVSIQLLSGGVYGRLPRARAFQIPAPADARRSGASRYDHRPIESASEPLVAPFYSLSVNTETMNTAGTTRLTVAELIPARRL